MTLQISEIPCADTEADDTGKLTDEMRISRRGMLRTAAVSLGALAAGPVAEALGGAQAEAAEYRLPRGFKGDISDLRHVVILMQENRSFDHYLG
ncbi:alkaline phosphatase family protein, partial [Streptomyces sp. DT225]